MYKDEERLLFSNFITVISILLAVYLFVAGNFSVVGGLEGKRNLPAF